MDSFMKDDPTHLLGSELLNIKPALPTELQSLGQLCRPTHLLGSELLNIKPALPIELQSLGQLCRPYDTWAQVVCEETNVPQRKTPGSAGHDLHSIEAATIPPGGSVVISTGVSIQMPSGHYGKIEGRSSLGIKHSVIPFGGIIDEDYRGIITISSNDRVAQLIIQRYSAPEIQRVSALDSTLRNQDGFGSTGR